MVNVLRKEGNKVIASDIKQYDFPLDFVGDFLTMGACPADVRAIVTNPPYSDDAEKFIRKAISFMRPVQGKVAMLMRHEYDTAATRMDLFTDPDFYEKIVITPRPRWIPGTKGAPRHSYAWYVWDFWSAKDRDFPRISYYKLLNAKRNKAYGD